MTAVTINAPDTANAAFTVSSNPVDGVKALRTDTDKSFIADIASLPYIAQIAYHGGATVDKYVYQGTLDGTVYVEDSYNIAPVITSTGVLTGTENEAYAYTLTATDADGDALTFSAVTIPSWATFNTATGLLIGTPLAGDIGANAIELTVHDGIDIVSQSFSIEVAEQIATPDRYFTELSSATQQHYTLNAPVTLTGDFEISVDFVYYVGSGELLSGDASGVLEDAFRFIAVSSRFRMVINGVFVDYLITAENYTVGKLYTAKITRVGGTVTVDVNGDTDSNSFSASSFPFTISHAGARIDGGFPFNSYLANLKITDGSTLVVDLSIDEDFGATNTAVNLADNSNNATAINITASEGKNFDDVNTWVGTNGEPDIVIAVQSTDTTAPVISINGDSSLAQTFNVALNGELPTLDAVTDDGSLVTTSYVTTAPDASVSASYIINYNAEDDATPPNVATEVVVTVVVEAAIARYFTDFGSSNAEFDLASTITLDNATPSSFQFDMIHRISTINQAVASSVGLTDFFRYNWRYGTTSAFTVHIDGVEEELELSTSLNDGEKHTIKFEVDLPNIAILVDNDLKGTLTNASWTTDINIAHFAHLPNNPGQEFEGQLSNLIFKQEDVVLDAFAMSEDFTSATTASSSVTSNTATKVGTLTSDNFTFDGIKTWTPVSTGTAFDNAPQA